jgi:outer membrane protein assembly factor BamB
MNITRRRFHSVTLAVAGAFGFSVGGAAVASANGAPWPGLRGNFQHTGRGPVRGPRVLALAWYTSTGADVDGSPVIAADGSVYIAAVDGTVFGLSSEGGLRWTYRSGAAVNGSVALAEDGRVLYGDNRGRVRALNADGTVSWTATGYGSISSTPAVGPNGTIYVGTDGGLLVGFAPDGKERSRTTIGAGVSGSPTIAPTGEVYVGAMDGRLRRLTAAGDIVWTVGLDGPIVSAVALGPDGTIYAGAGGSIVAVDSRTTGIKWRVGTGADVTVTPALGPDGTVYAGAENGRFYAVDPSGRIRWETQTGGAIRSSAAVGTDGTVYFGSGDSNLYAYSADGQRLSTYKALGPIHGSVAMDARGNVYAGSRDNRLYALRDGLRRFAQSPEDRLGGDLLRDPATGRVYVLVNDTFRHIPDPVTQQLLGLSGSFPTNVGEAELSRYVEGDPLSSIAEGSLLRTSNGPLYVVRGGRRVWIRDLDQFASGSYSWDALVPAEDLVVRSVPLAIDPGMLLQGADDRIYLVEGEVRRWITTGAVFAARGYLWANVHFLSGRHLQDVPEGDPLS